MQKCKNCSHVCIIEHNCRPEHSTEQFWSSSLLSSRQVPQLRWCILEGRGTKGVILQISNNNELTM